MVSIHREREEERERGRGLGVVWSATLRYSRNTKHHEHEDRLVKVTAILYVVPIQSRGKHFTKVKAKRNNEVVHLKLYS